MAEQRALVIGASGGIGAAFAQRLGGQGWQVTGLSRSGTGFDITDEPAIAAALAPLEPGYDLILVATGALAPKGGRPEKAMSALDPAALAAQFALNATGPALVLKHCIRLLPRDRRSVFAALSARVGSIGDNELGGWYSYRASKAALNQFIHTGATEVARSHRQAVVVTLHPGTVATAFTANYQSSHPTVSPAIAAENLQRVLQNLTAKDTGGFFDWQGARIPW